MDSQYYNVRPSYAHYPCYPPPPPPHHHLQNPNSPLPNHQIILQPLPPGVDPHATSSSYYYHSCTHVNGYEAQPYGNVQYPQEGALPTSSYYQDPSASQTWVSEDTVVSEYVVPPPPTTSSVEYSAAVNPLTTNSIYPTDPNHLSSQPLPNDASIPKESKVLQSVRCEVCKIECNSKDILDQHMLGKKHRKNIWLQHTLSNNFIPPAIASNPQKIKKPNTTQFGVQPSALASGKDLEIKRQKLLECGAAVGSVMLCSVCNVVCNSQIVFLHHLNGKQHAAQVGMIASSTAAGLPNSLPAFGTNTVLQTPWNKSKRKGIQKPKIVQSAWCGVCSIDCVTQDVFEKHKMGKKHQKKLEMLNEPVKITSTPASTCTQITSKPLIGPPESPSSNDGNTDRNKKGKKTASAPAEDVESKRQKVVSNGTATNAVRVCAICNVVCNSQTVFNYHLQGKQHAAMMKKHAEAA